MNKIILAITLIITGLLSFLKMIGSISMGYNEILGIGFVIFGFATVSVNLGKYKRGLLFLSAGIFVLGVIFIVVNNYEIYVTNNLVFPSILIIIGAGLLILFIDNTKEKVFLYSAFLVMLLGVFSSYRIDIFSVSSIANSIGIVFVDSWQIFLIIFGVLILLSGKTSK
jgi:hypothetical protein